MPPTETSPAGFAGQALAPGKAAPQPHSSPGSRAGVRANAWQRLRTQFLRYAVVGGLAFAVDAGLLWALTAFAGIYYLVSAAVSFSAGLVVNYLLSRFWVFDRRSLSSTTLEFTIFTLIGIVGLGLNQLLMWGFTEKFGLYYMLSKCFAAGFVLLWSFGARKWVLFSGAPA
ncbi:MAG TPA: GtrA family protein [Bryobacteraceae bacterium]|nr:GtrA family protein [Bryobacteraceae bacterium]